MSERTRRLMATWSCEQRLAFGLASIEEYFQALLRAEADAGATDEEAAARVRAKIRRWRA